MSLVATLRILVIQNGDLYRGRDRNTFCLGSNGEYARILHGDDSCLMPFLAVGLPKQER